MVPNGSARSAPSRWVAVLRKVARSTAVNSSSPNLYYLTVNKFKISYLSTAT